MERVLITTGEGTATEVSIGPGAIHHTVLEAMPSRRRVAVITQPAPRPYAETIAASLRDTGLHAAVRVMPDREQAKSLAVVEETYLWLNSLGMTRGDTLIAVGGGAVTDVGGFIGGTYLRGVETVLIPTTLLGAVDAAIGGKAAVNVGGKNLAGIFRHPAQVVVDTAILGDLPHELLVEGTAEAVKAGFIADPDLVDLYRNHGLAAPLEDVVVRAVKVKADVVSDDFTEQGRRAILNYGHTIGHAIEHTCGIPHGHAVAIGMVAAAAAAARAVGFRHAAAHNELIAALELPTEAPPVSREAVEDALLLDKKRDSAGLRMVLLEDFGRPTLVAVNTTTVHAALSAVGIE